MKRIKITCVKKGLKDSFSTKKMSYVIIRNRCWQYPLHTVGKKKWKWELRRRKFTLLSYHYVIHRKILLKCGCLVMFSINQTSQNSFRLVNINQQPQIVDDWLKHLKQCKMSQLFCLNSRNVIYASITAFAKVFTITFFSTF